MSLIHESSKIDPRFLDKSWRLQHLYPIRMEGDTVGRLKFNPIQERLYAWADAKGWKGLRGRILKARKAGITTFFSLAYLDDTMTRKNVTTLIMADCQKNLDKLFDIVRLAYERCPQSVDVGGGKVWSKPGAYLDNANELYFKGINSRIYVALTARGITPSNVHVSEAAHVEDRDRVIAVRASMRAAGTNISEETTANGQAGLFFEEWGSGDDYDEHFFGWWEDPRNVMEPEPGWEPGKEALAEAAKIAKRSNYVCTMPQMRFWDAERKSLKHLLRQEIPAYPEEAFLVNARSVYDADDLDALPVEKPKIVWKGFELWKPPQREVLDDKGNVTTPAGRYVVIVDPAGGRGGGDNAAIQVLERGTLDQCAEYASNDIGQVEQGKLGVMAARKWNNALLVVENVNSNGLTVITTALGEGYRNVYCEKSEGKKGAPASKTYGFNTNGHSRDLVLDELENDVSDRRANVRSASLQGEMRTFEADEAGRREAAAGKHDDRIMAYAIGRHVARTPERLVGAWNVG